VVGRLRIVRWPALRPAYRRKGGLAEKHEREVRIMAQSKPKSSSGQRYPEPELSEKAEKLHYWFDNGNRALAMLLTDTDDRLSNIEENMATKTDLAVTNKAIEALTELVKDGFNALGINIANGDHRVGGRAIRPVK
jgi:hypothetical protein